MFSHYFLANRQPQPRSMHFCGKKWCTDLIQILAGYTAATITDFNGDHTGATSTAGQEIFGVNPTRDGQTSPLRHRLESVTHKV